MSEPFFNRWSQRKQAKAQGLPVAEPVAPVPPSAPLERSPESGQQLPESRSATPSDAPAQALPSLDEARALTPASDFQPFMRPGVTADVRNVAMKKLFTDPHFNVMDGLDIYIGDYNTPDPLPVGMLQKMVGAQLLNLFPKDANDGVVQANRGLEVNPESSPAALNDASVVAQSPPSQSALALQATDPLENDHPDLQLQPNHAPAGPSPGQSTG